MMAQQRLSAAQALSHDWVKLQAPNAKGVQLKQIVGDRMLQFKVRNGLEKAALNIVASQLQDDKIRDLRDAFVKLDDNGDGKLTLKEMCAGLQEAGMDMTCEEAQTMF